MPSTRVAHNCLILAIVGRIPSAKDSIPAAGGPPRALSFWKNLESGCPSIRSKAALSSEGSPVAVRKHRWFASTIEDESHWGTRVNHVPVKPTSFHQPSIRPLPRP